MRSWFILLPVTAVLFFSGQVGAQETPGVTGSIERLSSSTPEEKLEYATRALDEMRAAQRSMERIGETAPECINDRLPLLNSLIEVSEIAQTNMSRWMSANNATRADSEFRKIAIALSEARTLIAEAERCNSGDEQTDGTNVVTYTYTGAVSEGDETLVVDEFDFDVGVDPPEASPFM